PVLKSQEYPDTLAAFDGIELLEDTTAPDELADLAVNVQQEAELMLNADQTHVMRIVEAGINGDETIDDIVADWNEAWNRVVERYAPEACSGAMPSVPLQCGTPGPLGIFYERKNPAMSAMQNTAVVQPNRRQSLKQWLRSMRRQQILVPLVFLFVSLLLLV